MNHRGATGTTLLKSACVYLLLSLFLGMAMAIRRDFSLMSVHSHLGLLGWVAMAVTGLVYLARPACAGNRLATLHFWLHQLGLPLMMGALSAVHLGVAGAEPLVGIGSTLVVLGLAAFAVNVFRHAGAGETAGVRRAA